MDAGGQRQGLQVDAQHLLGIKIQRFGQRGAKCLHVLQVTGSRARQRIGRPAPQRCTIAPLIQSQAPARQRLSGVLTAKGAQDNGARPRGAQTADQALRPLLLVAAERVGQPLGRLGMRIGECRFRPHPYLAAARGERRIVSVHRRVELAVPCFHTVECQSLAGLCQNVTGRVRCCDKPP